jgi:Ca2+/H+ antiporter, TMEM165/GDT1 family
MPCPPLGAGRDFLAISPTISDNERNMKSEWIPGMTATSYPIPENRVPPVAPAPEPLALVPEAVSVSANSQSEVSHDEILHKKASHNHGWKVFGTTFITIFLAELGDKTQVATLLMSAESHQPWTIFAGAASALVATSLLGVLVGCWLAARVSPQVLDRAAGITLAVLSVWLFWEVLG